MMFLLLVTALLVVSTHSLDLQETADKIQEVLVKKRELYGATSYECYEESGECVMEFAQDGLVTFREESLCARSEEGCGVSIGQRRKREQLCKRNAEDLQLCRREESECQFLMKRSEEMECRGQMKERAEKEKRDTYASLKKRSEELCTVGGFGKRSKRFISEECRRALEAIQSLEDEGITSDMVNVEKRAGGSCESGWSLYENKCYRYFSGPMSFNDAEANCIAASSDGLSHLATLESLVVSSDEDRAFFNGLIESSGQKSVLDEFFAGDDHFDWDAVSSDYYDNWAWIGVREVDGEWRWVSEVKSQSNWNVVKDALTDWKKGQSCCQESEGGDELYDGGKCISYFQHTDSTDENSTKGGWWNIPCKMELPSLCEHDPK